VYARSSAICEGLLGGDIRVLRAFLLEHGVYYPVAVQAVQFQQVASESWELFSRWRKLMFQFDASNLITKTIIIERLQPNCYNIFKFKTIQHENVKL